LKIYDEFEYNEKIFLGSLVDILYTSFKKSYLLVGKDYLGIVKSKKHTVPKNIKISVYFIVKHLYSLMVNKNGTKSRNIEYSGEIGH